MKQKTKEMIIKMMQDDPGITVGQMEALSGITEGELWNAVRQMKDAGEIDLRGIGHEKQWYIHIDN